MEKKLVVEVGVCRLWRLCLFKNPAAKTRQMCLIPLASPRVKSPTWRGKLNGRRAPQIETNRGVCGKCEELAGIGGLVSSLFQRSFERYLCDGSTCKAARLSTFFMGALPVRGWEVSSHMYLRRSTRRRQTRCRAEKRTSLPKSARCVGGANTGSIHGCRRASSFSLTRVL